MEGNYFFCCSSHISFNPTSHLKLFWSSYFQWCSLISCITISTNRFTKKIDCFQDHRNISFLFLRHINPFLANVPALYPLKTPENIWFSGVFRGYKMGKLTSNGLKASGKMLISDQIVSIFLWSKGRWSNFFVEINTKCKQN